MKKMFIGLVLALLSAGASASETPEQVIERLFDAMRQGDGAAIAAMVQPDARLDRMQKDGTIRSGTFQRWIDWVDQQAEGDADEQIFGVKVFAATPELATVWAPFIIHYRGALVGCGVNQFTLGKTEGNWRILYGIDKPYDGDCNTYRAQFPEG